MEELFLLHLNLLIRQVLPALLGLIVCIVEALPEYVEALARRYVPKVSIINSSYSHQGQ